MARRAGWAFAALVAMACGGPQAPTVTQTAPSAKPVKPPPPQMARWFFSSAATELADVLDLGNGVSLRVGDRGRRWTTAGDRTTDARELATASLVSVMRDADGRFVFLGERGEVFVSRDPLGPFVIVRDAPKKDAKPPKSITRGRAAMVIIGDDGRVVRSTDFGASWAPVEYAGATKPFGGASSVALDRNGNGVLVHLPQRLYVTHDDGATWKPITPPPMGATKVERDSNDRIFVEGFEHALAKLDGDAFVATTDKPAHETPLDPTSPDGSDHARVIVGDRVIALDAKMRDGARVVSVRSTRPGEPPSAPVVVAELATKGSLEDALVTDGTALHFLRADADGSTLLTSVDLGATWKPAGHFSGAGKIVAGPQGWLFVSGEKQMLRAAGATSFEQIVSNEEVRLIAFAFDEQNDKVYALGEHEHAQAIYEGKLSGSAFKRTPIVIPMNGWITPTLSIDDEGTLHVIGFDADKRALTSQRVDARGSALPTTYVPMRTFTDKGDVTRPTFVGARGVWFFGDAWGWETKDAGEHWARVGATDFSSGRCFDGGCTSRFADRIGWDLPALAPHDVVSGSTTIPEQKPPSFERHELPPPPSLALACKTNGATMPVHGGVAANSLGEGDVRWAMVETDEKDDSMTMVVASRTTLRRTPLLGPARKTPKTESWSGGHWVDGGHVEGRFTHATTPNAPPSVDAEIGWYVTRTGRVFHATISKLASDHADSGGSFPGSASIVPGGLLWTTRDDETLFVREDGRVDKLTLPPHASAGSARRFGTKWLLGGGSMGTALVSWSNDDGKTWQQAAWATNDRGRSTQLVDSGDHAWIGVENDADMSLGMISLAPPLGPELPSITRVPLDASIDVPCDPKAPWSRTYDIRTNGETVRATLGTAMTATTRLARFDSAGKLCNAGYELSDAHRELYAARERDGWSGWLVERTEKERKVTPVTCSEVK